MPNWCSNCVDVEGRHADVVGAAAQLMDCKVHDGEVMSDIALGEVSMLNLTKQERRSYTVTALAVSKD